jgi:hypothetical protein
MGEGVPLMDSYEGIERLGGYTINKDIKESRRSEFHYPLDPIHAKTKSLKKGINVLPTEAIKCLGYIKINEHT